MEESDQVDPQNPTSMVRPPPETPETIHLNITMPDNQNVSMAFPSTDTVWTVKQKLFGNSVKVLPDADNYGLYAPACNGRAAKFLDDERSIKEYPLAGVAANLALKYKQRISYVGAVNTAKLKKLNAVSNQRDFMELVKRNEVEKVDRILNRGFDPNFNNIGEETPLTASSGLSKPRSMIITLVSGGAFLDFRNKLGQTPIHVAVLRENKDAVRTLLDLGCSPNYRDSSGLTPLFHCCLHSKGVQCLNMLLHERAELDVRDANGWAGLHHAAKEGKVSLMEQLVFYGADINAQTKEGNTPLHISAKYRQAASCRVLLLRAADKTLRNSSGLTASDIAYMNKYEDIYRLINSFQPGDIVLFTEMPTYNDKRRGTLSMATIKNIARSRSIPNIHTLFSDPPDDPLSTISISSLNNFQTNGFLPKTSAPSHRVSAMDLRWNENKEPLENSSKFEGFQEHTFILQTSGNAIFGFTLNGTNDAHGKETPFQPSSESPARNFIAGVEAGKLAHDVGMKNGDFLVEINGTAVQERPHSFCVDSINKSGKVLRLKVLRKANNIKMCEESSSNSESSINKDLQATLDNFDKILMNSPAVSHRDPHESQETNHSSPVTEVTVTIPPEETTPSTPGIPDPPPPPPPTMETLGKSFNKIASSNFVERENCSPSGNVPSKPDTVRSSMGIFPDAAHDALMEAVKRRRQLVDNVDQSVLSENIENRISKTKKLRSCLNIPSPSKTVDSSILESEDYSSNYLLAPAPPQVKTLPKSFKKFHGDLSKSESLGDKLNAKANGESAEETVQSKTLPKKPSDLLNASSENSGDFLAVAEMLRQNFLKKKQQSSTGSQFSLNETSSNASGGSLDQQNREMKEDNEREKPTYIREPPKLADDKVDAPTDGAGVVQLKEENPKPNLPPSFIFPSKSRAAPPPPKKLLPLSMPASLDQEKLATNEQPAGVQADDRSPGGVTPVLGSGTSLSPVSFGNLASLVAEKAAQMHKTSEEKGTPFVSEPPTFGTTKRYTRSSETRKNLFASTSSQFTPIENKKTDVTQMPALTSVSPIKVTANASSVSEISKVFSSNVQPSTKVKPDRPEKTFLSRPVSQERGRASKEFKAYNGKFPIVSNKMIHSSTSAINLQGSNNSNSLNNNCKKTFKELSVIPPPKEYAGDGEPKLSGPARTNGASYTPSKVPSPPIKIFKNSSSDEIPASPDSVFPTLRKITSQQTSNTVVFKAKVGSTNLQKKT